jgi:hypothetical protein
MNSTNPPQKNLKDTLLSAIEEKHLAMRPRSYFILHVIAMALLAMLVLMVTVLIINFISFSIRINGHDSLLSFGPQGIGEFIHIFPWWLLGIDLILIALLELLVRSFKFGYRIPVLYMVLAIVLLSGTIGLVLDRGTTVNDHFLNDADHHRLPGPLNEAFKGVREAPHPGTCNCTVTGIQGNVLSADDVDPDSTTHYTIIVPMSDPLLPTIKVGDVVFAFGTQQGTSTISAFGLRLQQKDAD